MDWNDIRRHDVLTTLTEECFSIQEERMLHSGMVSPYFVDVPVLLQHPYAMDGLLNQLENLLINPGETDGFISPDFGGTFIATALQQRIARYGTFIPVFRCQKDGTVEGVTSEKLRGRNSYVIVDDVITSGTSVLPIIGKINEVGDKIIQVLTVVNRQHGGGENLLSGMHITLTSVFTLEEILACRKKMYRE